MEENVERIRELNDAFRTTFTGGEIFVTKGIAAFGTAVEMRVAEAVRTHTEFTEDNDPYGTHEFGVIDDPDAGKIFWKIDAYDKDLKYGSPDPSDPTVTRRVLTIYLSSEH